MPICGNAITWYRNQTRRLSFSYCTIRLHSGNRTWTMLYGYQLKINLSYLQIMSLTICNQKNPNRYHSSSLQQMIHPSHNLPKALTGCESTRCVHFVASSRSVSTICCGSLFSSNAKANQAASTQHKNNQQQQQRCMTTLHPHAVTWPRRYLIEKI